MDVLPVLIDLARPTEAPGTMPAKGSSSQAATIYTLVFYLAVIVVHIDHRLFFIIVWFLEIFLGFELDNIRV